MYPDNEAWLTTTPFEEIKSVMEAKDAVYEAAVALKKKGISVIPYDCRYGQDLLAQSKSIAALKKSKKDLEKKRLSRRNILVDIFKLVGGALLSGIESLAFDKRRDLKKEYSELRKEHAPEMAAYEREMNNAFAYEQENMRCILRQCDKDDGVLVQTGGRHLTHPQGLRMQLENAGWPTKSLFYMNEQLVGEMDAFVKGEAPEESVLPDVVLSFQTGKKIEVPKPSPSERIRTFGIKALAP